MRVQLLSHTAGVYLGFAKTKLRQLNKLRESMGVAQLSKIITVDTATIQLFSSRWNSYVRISGGATSGQILLSNYDEIYVYNYLTDTLTKADTAPHDFLYQRWNDSALVSASDDFSLAAGIHPRELSLTFDFTTPHPSGLFLLSGSAIQSLVGGVLTNLSTLPSYLTWYFLAQQDRLPITAGSLSTVWNELKAQIYSSFGFMQTWKPRVFYQGVGDDLLKPGLYYGGYLSPSERASEIKVRLSGLLRDSGDAGEYGYAEVMHSITPLNETEVAASRVSLVQTLSERYGSPTYALSQSVTYLYDSSQPGELKYDFDVEVGGLPVTGNLEVDWWATDYLQPKGEFVAGFDRVFGCVCYTDTGNAIVYRLGAGVQSIFTTSAYKGHSEFDNGRKVAVFLGEGVLIDEIAVLDIVNRDAEDNVASPSPVLRQSEVAASAEGVIGIGLLQGVQDDEFSPATYGAVALPDTRTSGHLGGTQLGDTRWTNFGRTWKVVIDEREATASWEDDTCGDGSLTKLVPTGSGPFTATIDGELYSAETWGGLASWPYCLGVRTDTQEQAWFATWVENRTKAAAIVSGANVSASTISDVGFTIRDYDNCLTPNQPNLPPFQVEATGEAEISGCNGSVPDPDAGDTKITKYGCPDDEIIWTDACGHTGSTPAVSPSYGPVINTSTIDVGYTFSVGGGVEPYSVSFDSGNITQLDATTWRFDSFTSCTGLSGEPRTGIITATDACGTVVEKEVNLPGGVWSAVSDVTTDPATCCSSGGRYTNSTSCSTYIGNYWYYELRYGFCYVAGAAVCPPQYCSYGDDGVSIWYRIITYQWQCP